MRFIVLSFISLIFTNLVNAKPNINLMLMKEFKPWGIKAPDTCTAIFGSMEMFHKTHIPPSSLNLLGGLKDGCTLQILDVEGFRSTISFILYFYTSPNSNNIMS